MLVSVHMTTFCQAESGWLSRAIDSVLQQTHRELELIIYDDASYDGSAAILQRYAETDQRVRVIRGDRNFNSVSKSLGTCFLDRNPAASAITWMFDDNVLVPDALESLVAAMVASKADVVYGQTRIHLANGESWDIGELSPETIAQSFLNTSAGVPNAGILIRPAVFEKAGWYDNNIFLRRSCDWDLFRRVWGSGARIKQIRYVCAEEYGEMSKSSLRNSFDTSFDMMKKYVELRDRQGFRVDVLSVVYGPADIIPYGEWTRDETLYIYRVFVRYFLSVGNLGKASEWAEAILESTDGRDLIYRNLQHWFSDKPEVLHAAIAGMFAGRINGEVPSPVIGTLPNPVALVGGFLQRRIGAANTELGKNLWRIAYRVARAAWRIVPRRRA